MKQVIFFLMFIPCMATAQINKGNWLIGGVLSGYYEQSKIFFSSQIEESSTEDINLIGQVGFFPINKLAVGFNAQYGVNRQKGILIPLGLGPGWDNDFTLTNKLWMAGPFVRYYLLPASNKLNFYTQAAYQVGVSQEDFELSLVWGDGENGGFNDIRAFQASVAPVLMLNKNVSLELILAYSRIKQLNDFGNSDRFTGGVGLQIHLGKPKKDN